MIICEVQQGTPEWHALRQERFTASEAPAMAGVSKYQSRTALLKMKHTGVAPDVTRAQQKIFDKGHATEAAARPIAEEIIGEELFPVTGISDDDPRLLASMDGCTMLEDVIWEHKHINDDLRSCVPAGDLAEHYKVQMDQQLYVTGAERCLFMASDGTRENCVHMWYERDEQRIKQLIAGWDQFESDLKAYKPEQQQAQAVGAEAGELPRLDILISGGVESSNLPAFQASAQALIEGIKTELATDQDFADAEHAVKWLKDGEKRIETSKKAALEQTASIDELFRAMDALKETMRHKRLQLDKLVKTEKDNRRFAIQREAVSQFAEWMTSLQLPVFIQSTLDIVGAMKGKKTIATLQEAADTEVARAKVEAQQEADRIRVNAGLLGEQSEGYEFLFADKQNLLIKAADDLLATIKARIAEHKEAEHQRLEAERARIRQEEEAKALAAQQKEQQAQQKEELPVQPAIDTSKIAAAAAAARCEQQKAQVDTVTISRKEYEELMRDQYMLNCLRGSGVDSWEGYDEAMNDFRNAYPED